MGDCDATKMSVSQVFAYRLRQKREAERISQPALAERMTQRGHPMSKGALLRLENGGRKVSLDEALAFAEVLEAVPVQLLSPPEGAMVYPTNQRGYDGSALRSWLRFGEAFHEEATASEGRLGTEILAHARALVDAHRGGKDIPGQKDAILAIIAAVRRQEARPEPPTQVEHPAGPEAVAQFLAFLETVKQKSEWSDSE